MTEIHNYTDEHGIPTQDHREMTNANVSSEGTYPQMADDFKLSVENSNESDTFIATSAFPIPDSYIVYINFGLSIQIATVNTIVVLIFLQKKNRSPVTILLSSLAISDTISAVIISVVDFIGYIFFSNQIRDNTWFIHYPQCNFIPYFMLASQEFHFVSVYMTAVLSAQKAIAVLFPFWSKSHINTKLLSVVSAFGFGFVLCIYVTKCAIVGRAFEERMNECVVVDPSLNYEKWFVLCNCIFYIVAVTVILVSTGILCCKLTCLKKSMFLSDFGAARNRNRRSAVIVILISVIFVFSEGIAIYILSVYFRLNFVYFTEYDLPADEISLYLSSLNFVNLSWMIGYSLNFIVYLLMGKKLRSTIGRGCSKMCNIFRFCH